MRISKNVLEFLILRDDNKSNNDSIMIIINGDNNHSNKAELSSKTNRMIKQNMDAR